MVQTILDIHRRGQPAEYVPVKECCPHAIDNVDVRIPFWYPLVNAEYAPADMPLCIAGPQKDNTDTALLIEKSTLLQFAR